MSVPPRRARVRALAKINLDLRVLGERPDGYHELRTIFQTISLADTLRDRLHARRAGPPSSWRTRWRIPDNLVARAARAGHGSHARDRPRRDAADQADSHGRGPGRRIVGCGGGAAGPAGAGRAPPGTGPLVPDWAGNWAATCRSSCWAGRRWESAAARSCFRCPTERPARGVLVAPGVHVSTAEAYRRLSPRLTSESQQNKMVSFQSQVWEWGCRSTAACNDFEDGGVRAASGIWRDQEAAGAGGSVDRHDDGQRIGGVSGCSGLRGRFPPRIARRCGEFAEEKKRFAFRWSAARAIARMWWRALEEHITAKVWPPRSRYAR